MIHLKADILILNHTLSFLRLNFRLLRFQSLNFRNEKNNLQPRVLASIRMAVEPLGFSEQQFHADTISAWKGHLPPFAGKHADVYKCVCMLKWLTLKRH